MINIDGCLNVWVRFLEVLCMDIVWCSETSTINVIANPVCDVTPAAPTVNRDAAYWERRGVVHAQSLTQHYGAGSRPNDELDLITFELFQVNWTTGVAPIGYRRVFASGLKYVSNNPVAEQALQNPTAPSVNQGKLRTCFFTPTLRASISYIQPWLA